MLALCDVPLGHSLKRLVFIFQQNVSYGQTKEFNCEHCHNKLSILAESTKFQYIQPRVIKTGQSSFITRGISGGVKTPATGPVVAQGATVQDN